MERCKSIYQNRNERGEALGAPKRCTRVEGHTDTASDDMHRNFTPGHKVKWPERAAEKIDA